MNNVIKIFLPAVLSFIIGILITPVATHYFYKYKMWRKVLRKDNITGENATKNLEVYEDKSELSTPRVGGMIVWMSVFLTVFVLLIVNMFFSNNLTDKIFFISRNQTILPLFALLVASLIGLGDDFLQIFAKGKWASDPMFLRYLKIGIILLLGIIIGCWFYFKLGVHSIYIPWYGFINLGYLFIPFFIIVMLWLWSSSVIDGIDGLSGGVLASIFGTYTVIAFLNNQIDLAALSAVITGGILAFLWFNIPPARFYMGETGMIGRTVVLSVFAFFTDTVLLIPILTFPLFITSLSVIIQMLSKKLRNGKRVFIVSPLHHHFEAIGWSKYKVVMRFWVFSVMSAVLGVIIYLIS